MPPATPGQESAAAGPPGGHDAAGLADQRGSTIPAGPPPGEHDHERAHPGLPGAPLLPADHPGTQDRPTAHQSGGPGRARRAAVAGLGLRGPCVVLNELVFSAVRVSPGPVGARLDDGTGTCLVASGAEIGARVAVVPLRPADGLLWLAPGYAAGSGRQVLRRVPLRGRRASRSARRRLRSTGAWPGRGLLPRAGTGSRVRAATAAT
jgi:hypothetical protein